jgi:hypothetical protein
VIIKPPESLDFFEPVLTPLVIDGYHPKGYIVPPEYLLSNISREHPLWKNLVERITEKKQTRILVPELADHDIQPSTLKDLKTAYVSTGAGARTIYSRNVGMPDCRYMPPETGGIGNSELARMYIRLCIEEAKKEGKTGRSTRQYLPYLGWPATLFYEPGPLNGRWHDDFAYVDISSAYWTLQRTSTIDMQFVPGEWVLEGRIEYRDTDEVTAYRGLRHAVPGSLRCGDMQMYRYGFPVEYDFKSNLSYPGLVGYTMYTMHCIAREVIDHFDAKMILTDAYIVPRDYADMLIDFLWERWGVNAIMKAAGPGALYGLNIYQVGAYRTGHAPVNYTSDPSWMYVSETGREMELRPDSSAKNNLLDVDSAWMCRERSKLLRKGLGRRSL